MIVEQTMKVANNQEAQDCLAGWRGLPEFRIGYIREATETSPTTLVGLFTVADSLTTGRLRKTQRKVSKVETAMGGWPLVS